MRIDLDSSELNRLVAELEKVPVEAHVRVRQAVQFTSFGIKKAAQEFASGLEHAPHYPRSITYDTTDRGVGDGVSAEIGPDKRRTQGALGNILEYGTVNNPPYAHLGPALDIWTPDLERGLEKAAGDALDGKA